MIEKQCMFKTISPEKAGISSTKVLEFIKVLEKYRLNTHSIIMARGYNIFAETYYAPFDADFQHRMYSVSKSFIAIAVGLAEQEGLLSLEDKFIKYFPEYRNEHTDELYEETTIKDLLTMRSCIADKNPDWWAKEDRAKTYFDLSSNKVPGTNFSYDSTGSMLLGCIVEKLTGMPFMEYLKEKLLLDIGFSEKAYCLKAPGGYSHSDSGVMCTSRELLAFARFVMNQGVWNGKRYINENFMQEAISKQTDNYIEGHVASYNSHGYGYLIWKAPRDGFAFIGMADQLAICDPKTDFIFVITSENMGFSPASRMLIFHELYRTIVENLDEELEENEHAYAELKTYMKTRKMLALTGGVESSVMSKINGVTYKLEENAMGIDTIRITIADGKGTMVYTNKEGLNTIQFGIGYNEFGHFPGKKRMSITASEYEKGNYACGASAIWCEEEKLHILVRIIDTYLGTLSITLGYKDDKISVAMNKWAQRILDDYNGYAVGNICMDCNADSDSVNKSQNGQNIQENEHIFH